MRELIEEDDVEVN